MINNYDIAVLSEKVAYLEAAIKNAGIELPEVTTDDNGKTLQVVAGKWDKGNKIPGVVNALDSTSTTDALSAAQGKALNDKLTPETYTITTNNSDITIARQYAAKIGRLFVFDIAFTTTEGTSNAVFDNFPIPEGGIYDGAAYSTGQNASHIIYVTNEGALIPRTALAGSGTFVLSGSYIID